MRLTATFFSTNSTLTIAQNLLGKKLVRVYQDKELSGLIVETEVYVGQSDSACHAAKGYTPRTAVMFGPPGRVYVYLIYGMYHMLNIVTGVVGHPCAILIRALQPVEGQDVMASLRGHPKRYLTDGPGRLCQALAINKTFNHLNLITSQQLWLEDAHPIPDNRVATGPRINISYANRVDQQLPWRFWIKDNPHVSQ